MNEIAKRFAKRISRQLYAIQEAERAKASAAAAHAEARERELQAKPEMKFPDPVEEWKRRGEEREQARQSALAERRETEQREIREARRHELRLAKAAANGDVDWAAVLNAIADTFDGIARRLDTLEVRVDALDNNKSKTRPLDLPNFLAPRTSDDGKLRYSQPLMTVRE